MLSNHLAASPLAARMALFRSLRLLKEIRCRYAVICGRLRSIFRTTLPGRLECTKYLLNTVSEYFGCILEVLRTTYPMSHLCLTFITDCDMITINVCTLAKGSLPIQLCFRIFAISTTVIPSYKSPQINVHDAHINALYACAKFSRRVDSQCHFCNY